MSVITCLEKPLSLSEIQKAIDYVGSLSESTLYVHSLALIIGISGEATFTQCGWKVLSEAGFSCPLTKFIINGAKKYTVSCGEDCKYFLFILKEMFSILHSRVKGNTEAFTRIKFINEITALKHALPCVFNRIYNMSVVHITNSDTFVTDLSNIVMTFMLCRFSKDVSEQLASLICNFILSVNCDMNLLTVDLDYVISHFDMFCTKVITSVSESKILKGFLLFKKCIPSNLKIDNCKFVIILDLSMKMQIGEVVLKISDKLFVNQLNPHNVYQKIFEYFKMQNINLLLTPSSSGNNIKLLCKENNIILLDHIDIEEINHILNCYQLNPLENLNESLDSKHIGELDSVETLCFNKTCFLHLICSNTQRLLNLHHILLCAPIDTLWKEYYSECLNCLKLVHHWLSSCHLSTCYQVEKLISHKSYFKRGMNASDGKCSICSQFKSNFEIISTKENTSLDFKKSHQNFIISLPPCSWEFLLKTELESISEEQSRTYKSISDILCLAIQKCISKRIGVSFTESMKFKVFHNEFSKKDNIFLEPVTCKEIMIFNVLNLILQLLKVDKIISSK